jgi:Fe-S-cluster containining protein
MPVHVLGFHAPYRCRHEGVCCTSGWDIPVDAPLHRTLHAAIEWGQIRVDGFGLAADLFEPARDLPNGEPVVLRRRSNGACVFFEPSRGNQCAIQRQTDHDHLPAACRHFPRVVVIDPRGVFVTMSHVCPTSAGLLIQGGSCEVVTGASGFDEHVIWEGLDARDELPPLLTRDLLWSWDGWDRWERGAVRLLAGTDGPPEQALAALGVAVTAISGWRPRTGPLMDAVESALAAAAAVSSRWDPPVEVLVALESLVIDSGSPGQKPWPAPPPGPVPGWNRWTGAIRRYLAARAFANWVGYHGDSLATWYKSILAAYAVLRTGAARVSASSGQALDRAGFVAALADADRLIVHRSSARELAALLDSWEERR